MDDNTELTGNEVPDTFELEDGVTVSLGDFAGVPMDSIAEKRAFKFPGGNYQWELKEASVTKQDRKVKDSNDKKSWPAFQIEIECVEVHSITEKDKVSMAQECIGKKLYHSWVIKKTEDLGYIIAFANDAGMKGKSAEAGLEAAFKDLASKGFRFNAKMRVRQDPNNSDNYYRNLDVPDEYNEGSVKAAAEVA